MVPFSTVNTPGIWYDTDPSAGIGNVDSPVHVSPMHACPLTEPSYALYEVRKSQKWTPVATSTKSYSSVMLHVLPTHGCGSVRRYGTVPPSGYIMSLVCSVALCQLASLSGMFFQSSMTASPVERATTLLADVLHPLAPVTVTLSVMELPLPAVQVMLEVAAPPVIVPLLRVQA